MDDAMRERLLEAAKRLVASDEAYAAARRAMDLAVSEQNESRGKIVEAMAEAEIRLFCVGDVLFEWDSHSRAVHWHQLDAVLPGDRGRAQDANA